MASQDQSRGAVINSHVIEHPHGIDDVVDPLTAGPTPVGVQLLLASSR